MAHIKKNVAVIGAGPSGLVTIKELLEEGHQVTCFEKSMDVGGVYRYAPDNVGVYESAQLASSAFVTSFSDYPPPKDAPLHFKQFQYFQYLRDYAAHFALVPHIKFKQAVRSADRTSDGIWRLKVFDQNTQKEEEHVFDAVAVCAGMHQNLAVPEVPNKENFQGSIVHSGQYKTADPFKNKNVVVVGGGESGSDIVEEVSRVTNSCVLSLRRGALVVPRLIFDRPNDFYTNRLLYAVPTWFLRIRHNTPFHWPSIFLTLLLTVVGFIYFRIIESLINNVLLVFPAFDFILMAGSLLLTGYFLFKIFQYVFGYVGLKELLVMSRLNFESKVGHAEQFATKCQGIATAIAQKKCFLKSGIKRFTARGVEFADGTTFEADAVIFCTGYVTIFPFLAIKSMDTRKLYKNCFDPAIGPTLCFIGLARPASGAIPPIAEMQARWFAQVLSGNRPLPSEQKMREEITKDTLFHRQLFSVVSDRITGLVDFTLYMEELAALVGCNLRWNDLLKDPGLLFRIHFNPFLGCQYRLRGPHPQREKAKKIMASVPLNIFQFTLNCLLLTVVIICEILYRLGFKYFKPNLRF